MSVCTWWIDVVIFTALVSVIDIFPTVSFMEIGQHFVCVNSVKICVILYVCVRMWALTLWSYYGFAIYI